MVANPNPIPESTRSAALPTQDWGLEVTMGALLVAAFAALNALSLVHMALIGVGMAAPPRPRRVAWRLACLPLLAALLLFQYSVLIGLPPGLDPGAGDRSGMGSERRDSGDDPSEPASVKVRHVLRINMKRNWPTSPTVATTWHLHP